MRGDGPLPEGAEPTERIAAPSAARPVESGATVTPAEPHIPAQRDGDSEPTPTGAGPSAAAGAPESNASPQDGDSHPPPTGVGEQQRHGSVGEQRHDVGQQQHYSVAPPSPAPAQPPYVVGEPPATPLQWPYDADSAQPPHGTGQPFAVPHQPPYGEVQPTSGTPYGPAPTSPPYSGAPYPADQYAFGQPIYTPAPSSGSSPQRGDEPAYGPFHGGGPASDPDPYGFSAPPGRRIEPTPPPDRGRLIVGVVAGLVAGLLLFGTAGWFAGRATAPEPKSAPTRQAPAPTARLGVFEQNQVAINQPDFAGTGLVNIAQGWLPYLATCTRSGTPGGPALNAGEKFRVRCTLDGMSAIFVEYASTAERDKGRNKILGRAADDARTLAPGAAPATKREAPSGRTSGNYIEYAYRLTERGTTRTVSGIWWEDERTPVATYLLAYWKDGVGESWEPMRDLWSRYA